MKLEFPSPDWADYELVDCGRGEKLERFGSQYLVRPEPKALWDPSLSQREWTRLAHTRFRPGAGFGKAGKEDSGTWDCRPDALQQWYIQYGSSPAYGKSPSAKKASVPADPSPDGKPAFTLRLGLTAFKHVGVFPEQAPNWDYIYRNTRALCEKARAEGTETPRVLNLFAYTGAASLAAKAAGADVIHLDSVRQVVTWARGNMEQSGLEGIRWLVEDAMKFVAREARRGHLYQGIILDPPAYGHGPDGEKWKLDECLFDLLKGVATLLAPQDSFLVLNLYSNGYTATLADTLVREAFGLGYAPGAGTDTAAGNGNGGGTATPGLLSATPQTQCGELVLRDRSGKLMPLSVFVRMRR